MKLIRGSYSYIIGLFILGVDGIVSIVAFFLSIFCEDEGANPLLSEYGSRMASGVFSTVACALFTLSIMMVSTYALYSALKKNSLAKPFRVIAVLLVIYALLTALFAIFYSPKEETVLSFYLRIFKAVLPIVLAICLVFLSLDDLRFKIPCIVLCALCAFQSFVGYGLYRAFVTAGTSTPGQKRSYAAIVLFSVSLLLFFVGLSFFIAGSTSGGKNKKRS